MANSDSCTTSRLTAPVMQATGRDTRRGGLTYGMARSGACDDKTKKTQRGSGDGPETETCQEETRGPGSTTRRWGAAGGPIGHGRRGHVG